MIHTVPDILSRIVEHKRAELSALKHWRTDWEKKAASAVTRRRDFHAALASRAPAIIAEIKKASPSKGVLVSDFQPAAIAQLYEQGGAVALSVLTDERYFQGNLVHLKEARTAVRLPVLRKDFTIDEMHVIEAAAHGADAILLIAAILSLGELTRLRELAATYRMAALVEVHDERELQVALDSGAEILGVNNRDLHTFQVTLETSVRLASQIPQGILRVSESGINNRRDVKRLREAGYHAFLVGEHLMRAADPVHALRAMLG